MSSRASSPLSSASPSPPLRPSAGVPLPSTSAPPSAGPSKAKPKAKSSAKAPSKAKPKSQPHGRSVSGPTATVPAPSAPAGSKPMSKAKSAPEAEADAVSSPPLSELDSQEMPEVPDGGDANGPSSPNGTGRGDGFVRSPTSSTMKPGSDEEDEDSDLTDEDDEAGAGNAAVGDDVDVDMDAGARPASSPTKPPSASAKSGLSRHDDRSKSKSASASKLEIKQEVAGSDADVDADGEEEDDEEVIISPRTRRAAKRLISGSNSPTRPKSPSLTPPPPSSEIRARALPSSPPAVPEHVSSGRSARANGRQSHASRGGNDDLEQAVQKDKSGSPISSAGSVGSRASRKRKADEDGEVPTVPTSSPTPPPDEVEEGDSAEVDEGADDEEEGDAEDGDVTMRPAEEEDDGDTPNGNVTPVNKVATAEQSAVEGMEAEGAGMEAAQETEGQQREDEAANAAEGDGDDQDKLGEQGTEANGKGEVPPVTQVEEGDAQPDEGESEETTGTPVPTILTRAAHAHSSHPPPPSAASVRALFMLELKFAALRDRLYIERMEEAAEEEELLLNGTHPALQMLHKTLSARRERLHEVASRRHAQALEELKVVKHSEHDAIWSWWTEERDSLHWLEFEQTWSKRRKLAREKNDIESPKLAKAVPRVIRGGPPVKSYDWANGPAPAKLTVDEAMADWQMMEQPPPQLSSRHASPNLFPTLTSAFAPQQYPSAHPNQYHHQHQQLQMQQQHQQAQANQYPYSTGPGGAASNPIPAGTNGPGHTYAEALGHSSAHGSKSSGPNAPPHSAANAHGYPHTSSQSHTQQAQTTPTPGVIYPYGRAPTLNQTMHSTASLSQHSSQQGLGPGQTSGPSLSGYQPRHVLTYMPPSSSGRLDTQVPKASQGPNGANGKTSLFAPPASHSNSLQSSLSTGPNQPAKSGQPGSATASAAQSTTTAQQNPHHLHQGAQVHPNVLSSQSAHSLSNLPGGGQTGSGHVATHSTHAVVPQRREGRTVLTPGALFSGGNGGGREGGREGSTPNSTPSGQAQRADTPASATAPSGAASTPSVSLGAQPGSHAYAAGSYAHSLGSAHGHAHSQSASQAQRKSELGYGPWGSRTVNGINGSGPSLASTAEREREQEREKAAERQRAADRENRERQMERERERDREKERELDRIDREKENECKRRLSNNGLSAYAHSHSAASGGGGAGLGASLFGGMGPYTGYGGYRRLSHSNSNANAPMSANAQSQGSAASQHMQNLSRPGQGIFGPPPQGQNPPRAGSVLSDRKSPPGSAGPGSAMPLSATSARSPSVLTNGPPNTGRPAGNDSAPSTATEGRSTSATPLSASYATQGGVRIGSAQPSTAASATSGAAGGASAMSPPPRPASNSHIQTIHPGNPAARLSHSPMNSTLHVPSPAPLSASSVSPRVSTSPFSTAPQHHVLDRSPRPPGSAPLSADARARMSASPVQIMQGKPPTPSSAVSGLPATSARPAASAQTQGQMGGRQPSTGPDARAPTPSSAGVGAAASGAAQAGQAQQIAPATGREQDRRFPGLADYLNSGPFNGAGLGKMGVLSPPKSNAVPLSGTQPSALSDAADAQAKAQAKSPAVGAGAAPTPTPPSGL